jgi:hypothetical protein
MMHRGDAEQRQGEENEFDRDVEHAAELYVRGKIG